MLKRILILTAALTASECLTEDSLAHDGEGTKHWEIASPDPDRIFLSFYGDPARSRAVTWRTDTSVKASYAEIAVATPGPTFTRYAKRLDAKTEPLTLGDGGAAVNKTTHYHSVVFEGLDPNTLYAYRVGHRDHWSEWMQFHTASTEAEPFRFLYFGDAQNEVHSTWSRVIRMAHRTAPDAAFAIHAGDMVNDGHADDEWAEWMTAGGHLHAETTGVPVAGNHEFWPLIRDGKEQRQLSIQWRPQFTLPIVQALPEALHETVYSFVYQGVQVIVLNSNIMREAQSTYLKQKLAEGDHRWRIVTFHHPIFAPSRGLDSRRVRDHWKEVLERMGADLVLQGHDHTYARGNTPRRSVDGEAMETLGTVYVTSVSGPKMYKIDHAGLARFQERYGLVTDKSAENIQFFQVIDVNRDRLAYRAYTATGSLYDAVAIEKDEQGNKRLVENPFAE